MMRAMRLLRIDEIAAILIECIQDLERRLFITFAESRFPVAVNHLHDRAMFPETYHLSPKFIAPKHSGLTLTAAVGARTR